MGWIAGILHACGYLWMMLLERNLRGMTVEWDLLVLDLDNCNEKESRRSLVVDQILITIHI